MRRVTPDTGRAQRAARRVEIGGRLVAPVPGKHGNYSTYTNWSCRCELCVEAATRQKYVTVQDRFARRTVRDGRPYASEVAEHGSYSTYINWGCRCDPCTAAIAADRRRRRLKK